MKRVGNTRKGFTVVELIIVVVVIAILAGLVIVGYRAIIQSSRNASVETDGSELRSAIGTYGLNNGSRYQSWFSGNGIPASLSVNLTQGNIADFVVSGDQKEWCLRIYNPQSKYDSITKSYALSSSPGGCNTLSASEEAIAASITSGWKSLAMGTNHVCGLAASNGIYCWGTGSFNTFGNGTTTGSTVPLLTANGGALASKTPKALSAGNFNTCALTTESKAYCWGNNTSGQVGNGNMVAATTPEAVVATGLLAGKTIVKISTGTYHSCALDSDGKAYCWGEGLWGTGGLLGNGSTNDSSTPVEVTLSGQTVRQLSVGTYSTCVLTANGDVLCWGYNPYGGFGNSTTTDTTTPVPATTGPIAGGIAKISVGDGVTCAISGTGMGYCWGYNTSGQAGVGTTTNVLTPTAVVTTGALSGKTLKSISAGFRHVCAIASDNLGYCWGLNTNGQLGNNSTANSSAPVPVDTTGVLAGKTLRSISAGGNFTCAIASDNQAYCWGINTNGRLGNGSTVNSSIPVPVTAP